MKNYETFLEDESALAKAYLSCSPEEIEKRLHEATHNGMDIVAQLEMLQEAAYGVREDISGAIEFINWLQSQRVVGLDFESTLGMLVAKKLSLIDEYPIEKQQERIRQFGEQLKNLPISTSGKTKALRLSELLPEKLIYQEDIAEQDVELEVEPEDASSRQVMLANSGVSAKTSYFVLMEISWQALFWGYTFVNAYTKSRYVLSIQTAPGEPWTQLPWHFGWIVDKIGASTSDTAECKGDKLYTGHSKKNASEVYHSWKFKGYSARSSFHEIHYKGQFWGWKWCDGKWKNGNAWYWE